MNRDRIGAICLLLASCLVLAGCGGGSAKDKLIGRWKADAAELAKQAEAAAAENPMAAMGAETVKSMEVIVEFKKDGTAEINMKMGEAMSMKIEGKWKVVEDSGMEATIEMAVKDPMTGKAEAPETSKVIFESNNKIKMNAPGRSQQITFTRV